MRTCWQAELGSLVRLKVHCDYMHTHTNLLQPAAVSRDIVGAERACILSDWQALSYSSG